MKTIYALLIGVDQSTAGFRKLRGCVNDIQEMDGVPRGSSRPRRADARGGPEDKGAGELAGDPRCGHPGLPRPPGPGPAEGDVALFCYSGHGSQEQAPEQFWQIEPDHLDETLVCHDSRTDGSWTWPTRSLPNSSPRSPVTGRTSSYCWTAATPARAPGLDLAETGVRRAPTTRPAAGRQLHLPP